MFKKQLAFFLLGGGASLILFLVLVALINRVINFPIFITSMALSVVVPLVIIFIHYFCSKFKIYDKMHFILLYFAYLFLLILFAIFGPVFIERSLSYYLVMYTSELDNQGKHATVEDITRIFSNERNTSLRIEQIQKSNFISVDKNGAITPNKFVKFISYVIYYIGIITNTLGEYNDIKK